MKAITIEKFGGVEEMHWSDLPTPQPKANEVQIEVACTSVNPVDWKIREGLLKNFFPYEFPLIPGWDAAGIISSVGNEVSNFKVGDEVFCYCRKPIVQWGTYAEYVCFESDHVALKPKKLSFAQAASIPLVGLTAWQALFDELMLKNGQAILIHAGAGGVGGIAIELAKVAGARVFTTASLENHEYVKNLGADIPIDYRKESFVKRVLAEEPDGIDAVLDSIGHETLEQSFNVLKQDGRLVSLVNKDVQNKKGGEKIHSSYMVVRPDGSQLKEIAGLIDEGKVHPPHITELPLSDYAKAHEMSKEGHTKGKIVLHIKK
jgi:NADPH:quinone reductase-like Zn-dependent oxidoreductase